MIRFFYPDYLYGLLLLPLLVAFYILVWKGRKKSLERFSSPAILPRLTDAAGKGKRVVKAALVLLAVAMMLLGLANPQVGTRLEEAKQEGIDMFLALDVSLSMKAEDIKPNRLEKAKFEIRSLISRLGGDRIGLVIFAGDAFTQFPLTTDYSAANLFLDAVDVDAVPVPGTAIGSAIDHAVESFNFEDVTTKVIVLITDGENTEGDAMEAAESAAKKGVILYTIGLGSPAGSPIPVYGTTGRQVDFKRDRMGSVVLSKLDEVTLEKIATVGSGKYFRGSSTQDELDAIYKSLNALQKKEFGVKRYTDYEDRFQYFLLLAVILIIADLLLSDRRSLWLAKWNPLRKEGEVGLEKN